MLIRTASNSNSIARQHITCNQEIEIPRPKDSSNASL